MLEHVALCKEKLSERELAIILRRKFVILSNVWRSEVMQYSKPFWDEILLAVTVGQRAESCPKTVLVVQCEM